MRLYLIKKIFGIFENLRNQICFIIFVQCTSEYLSCIINDKKNRRIFVFLFAYYVMMLSFFISSISAILMNIYPKYSLFIYLFPFFGLIFLIILLVILPWSIIEKWGLYNESCDAIFKNPCYLPEGPHLGIIFTHHKRNFKQIVIGDSIAILITKLLEYQIPYKVYHCYKKSDFIETYTNRDVVHLWIFGHGKRDRISLGMESEEIEYEKLPITEPKECITQLHCNTRKGRSLAEINKSKRFFVSNNYRDLIQNRCFISHYDFAEFRNI
jgi:hypothetical protein